MGGVGQTSAWPFTFETACAVPTADVGLKKEPNFSSITTSECRMVELTRPRTW